MGVTLSDIMTVAETMTKEAALSAMGQHFWALLPALVAIVLALITKEVYISLFVGIFVGTMYLGKGNPITALVELFKIMAGALGPETAIETTVVDGVETQNIIVTGAGNTGILIFILERGI